MSFAEKDIENTLKLIASTPENIAIAKEIYGSWIYNNKELTALFWDKYFKQLQNQKDSEPADAFQDLILNHFGIYGLDGIEYSKNPHGIQSQDLISQTLGVDSMNWHIHGYNVWHKITGGSEHGFCNVIDYEFIITGTPTNNTRGRFNVSVKFQQWYGSCGSGYCGASWGDVSINTQINNIKTHYKPSAYIPVKLIELYDKSAYLLGEIGQIARSTDDGGDPYYPNGYIEVNHLFLDHMFIEYEPVRIKDKPIVYFFNGDSGLGKSYIASLLSTNKNLLIYETDSLHINANNLDESFTDMLTSTIIVVGKKHKEITLEVAVETFKKTLHKENVKADIVVCDFTKW